jgi:hypothetical protein|tara:strand:- start:3154 stop:3669 length:516 start_codon:yes stop_codon:yes gene_type:complete
MSYDAVETSILNVIQILGNYDSSNSTQGDYRILARGNRRAVVLTPGAIRGREVIATRRRIATVWETLIELFIPFQGDIPSSHSAIRQDRQELIDHLDEYPTLNGTSGVVHAFTEFGREPEIWQGESSNFWKQILVMGIHEHQNIRIAEDPERAVPDQNFLQISGSTDQLYL